MLSVMSAMFSETGLIGSLFQKIFSPLAHSAVVSLLLLVAFQNQPPFYWSLQL